MIMASDLVARFLANSIWAQTQVWSAFSQDTNLVLSEFIWIQLRSRLWNSKGVHVLGNIADALNFLARTFRKRYLRSASTSRYNTTVFERTRNDTTLMYYICKIYTLKTLLICYLLLRQLSGPASDNERRNICVDVKQMSAFVSGKIYSNVCVT